ncbi:class I SAM-dependent methyltransferase [Isosphaeraceae bacterium EP7]
MDSPEEARNYDAMDHSAVNLRFVADFLAFHGPCRGGEILDVGTGPGQIPIALCLADPAARVVGVDLARHMLDLAAQNVEAAGLAGRIRLQLADAKRLDGDEGLFEAVLSNSIVHHIPDPAPALAEMARSVAPGGTLFIRDLFRPGSAYEVDLLVELYNSLESAEARDLFRDSLNASLTLAEIRSIVAGLGYDPAGVKMTSDRHWTWAWRRPPA